MIAVLDVLELLTAARTLGKVQPHVLAQAIKKHLDAYSLSERPRRPTPELTQRAALALASLRQLRPLISRALLACVVALVTIAPDGSADYTKRHTGPT